MADVATLGLAVESSGVDKGAMSLTKLSMAAAKAEAAAAGVSAATRNASTAATSLAASSGNAAAELNQEGAAAAKAASALRAHYVAANSNAVAAKAGGQSMRMMAMQLSQVAQQTQAGAGFIQALAIQLPDLALGFGTVGIALGVVAGIMLPLIHAGHLTAAALNVVADAIVPIAPYALTAAAALALLYAPAILGGLTFLAETILGVTARLVGLAAGFALANPAVAFVAGLVLAVAAANVFRDQLTQIFGVDIVGVAKDAVNYIIGAFVGGFAAIKVTWSELPAAIGDIVYQAADFTVKGVEAMINTVIDKINSFVGMAYNSLSGLASKVGVDIGKYTKIDPVSLGGVANPYAGAASGVAGAAKGAVSDAMSADYVGAGLKVIAKGAEYATGKVKELAGWMAKVDDPKAKKGKHGGKTDEEKFSDIVTDANAKLATLKAEQASVGMSEVATAKLRYETELLNEAQQKGITITAAQRGQLMGLADQMAETAVATKKAKEQLEFVKDATRGFIDDLRQGLENGEGFWKSFGNAAMNVLDKIITKIEDELLNALFEVGNAGSGGGGLIGSILGAVGLGGSSSSSFIPNTDLTSILTGQYANGTASARAGLAMVGERGPELVRFRGGEKVTPNHMLGKEAANNNGSGPISVTFAPVFQGNQNEASKDDNIRQLRKVFDQEFLPRTVKAIRQAKTQGLLS
ncbi:phage tail tape-measure protein [Mesorhizobium australicum]|uniref:phage tail tape-measure protein n=1 Tax=Mesorhizobium australicum TaxID=536018 RepID=UPI00333BCA4D